MNESDDKIPVKYVLYSHYSYNQKQDFEHWDEATNSRQGLIFSKSSTPLCELDGIKFLISHVRTLRDLLTSPGHEGLVVLFYAPGLPQCFDGIALGKSRPELLKDHAELRFAEAVSSCITEELAKDRQLLRRVRFVTALDLYDIFSRVKALEAQDLRWWIIGETTQVRYDTPKIVEAIVRLRLLGNGVPVFRLDWDVLFNGNEGQIAELGLFKAVAICLKAYRLRLDDPTVATFLFSASYDMGQLRDAPQDARFENWRGAFATRVFPAIPIIPELLAKAEKKEISWEEYAHQTFSESLARRFYGFLPNELKCDGVNGLANVGAHPMVSVISGAFLCLSDGAILDLPPFSNFSLNVSWIDDHLKYCLHRELRHLTSLDLRLADRGLSDAKLDDVMVAKKRSDIPNLPKYVLEDYLPTLLWWTIVDAWINPDPLLKCRPDDLCGDDQAKWHRLPRTGRSNAILPCQLQVALETGRFSHADRFELKKLLITKALERITEVRSLWSELRDSVGHESFASVWAKGLARDFFPNLNERSHGIAPGRPLTDPVNDETQLNAFLRNDFNQVVEDALMYIDWTLNWPRIVHIVRSIEQGTLRTDMSWKP